MEKDHLPNSAKIFLMTTGCIISQKTWQRQLTSEIDVKIVNEREGYFYPLILTNPMEVVYEND